VITRLLSFGRDGRWKKIMLSRLPNDSTHGRPFSCLDLACGTGDISRLLSLRYPRGTIYAVDLNPEMLRRAKARTDHANIRFHRVNMNELPFADASCDIVTSGYALRNSLPSSDHLSRIFPLHIALACAGCS
jgi:ubiquinone/menaquinone biosynthesis C-methylase UbiE